MRRTIGAVGATLTATGLILGGTGLVARAATPQTSQANAALRYLYSGRRRRQRSPAFGPGATEDTVISVADNGYDPATLKSSSTGTTTYHYLAGQASSINTAGGAAKYVLAWMAAGKPAAIDGSTELAKLNAPTRGRLPAPERDVPQHHDESASAYKQALGVLADRGAGVALPAHATGWLSCVEHDAA